MIHHSSTTISTSLVSETLRSLFAWAKEQDFLGHDPHDLLNSSFLKNTGGSERSQTDQLRYARLLAVQLGRRSQMNVRSFLRVPRTENPKALALFLSGLLRAETAATPDWEIEADVLGSRLIAAMSDTGGWGYPFPWQSRTHFLPRFTPNIVTTAFAGSALIELLRSGIGYRVSGIGRREAGRSTPIPDTPYPIPDAHGLGLEGAIAQAGCYIVERIPHIRPEGVAFGYAEDDPQIVYNASLLGAEFLLNAGRLLGIQEYVDLAQRAAMFVAEHQQPDGSWKYGLEPSQTWIDSFHTGVVIVSMSRIAEILGNSTLRESADRGFEYYRRTFIEPDFAVKYFADRHYPIDAHAIGQALVTLATFRDIRTAEQVAVWAIRNMRSPKGYFYYQRHRLYTNRIAYMRWSNAWMFRGLSEPGLR